MNPTALEHNYKQGWYSGLGCGHKHNILFARAKAVIWSSQSNVAKKQDSYTG